MNSPFVIPSFKGFVSPRFQPWIYVFIAACFQLSGGRYLGALNYMVGEEQLMREDLLMALYCNLTGMATYFPLLFRMKFRFTNKSLLCTAAIGVLVTNLLIPYVTFKPLLWALCFIEGVCKLQGTFECISNIQLWFTPQRDFRVFFPVLHLFIMGSMNVSSWLAVNFAFGWDDWRLTHWFIAGLMLVILLILTICTRNVRIFPKTPLWGIDWAGYALWNMLCFQVCYLMDYGDWMSWFDSPITWTLVVTICITVGLIYYGTLIKPHAYIPRKVFRFHNVKGIIVLITLFEILMAAERVLEEIFLEEGLGYTDYTGASRHLVAFLSSVLACGFAYWWLKVRHWGFIRLGVVAASFGTAYLALMYFLIDPGLSLHMLYLPVFCRSMATVLMSIMLMTQLNYSLDFHTFFQGLSCFNMIHMMGGGAIGGAIYSKLFGIAVGDAFARYTPWLNEVSFSSSPFNLGEYMERFTENMLLIGVREVYGYAVYAGIILILLYLFYDTPARRFKIYRMENWHKVGRRFFSPLIQRKVSEAKARTV